MEAEALRKTNPDAIFCAVVFVVTLLFPLGAVSYSILGAKQETLRRPSWNRFSIDWWGDPLQCLLISCWSAAGLSLGAALHLRGTTQTGFWTFMTFCSIFVGLLIGQIFVYAAYRNRIVEADSVPAAEISEMRRRYLTRILGITGVGMLIFACISATQNKLVAFWGFGTARHEALYTRAEHPQLFLVLTISFAAIGVFCLGGALWLTLVRRSAQAD